MLLSLFLFYFVAARNNAGSLLRKPIYFSFFWFNLIAAIKLGQVNLLIFLSFIQVHSEQNNFILDLTGGSGICAHIAKEEFRHCFYNDMDQTQTVEALACFQTSKF